MKFSYDLPIIHNGVFVYDLDINEDFIPYFESLKFENQNEDQVKLSINKNVLNNLPNLKTEIYNALHHLVSDVLLSKQIDINIYHSWVTQTGINAESHPHKHANAWFSGVFYPEEDPSFGLRIFNDNLSIFQPEHKAYGIYNSYQFELKPKKNQLFIFFSTLRHQVMKNKSNKYRYSLAFNALPKGSFGSHDSTFNFKE